MIIGLVHVIIVTVTVMFIAYLIVFFVCTVRSLRVTINKVLSYLNIPLPPDQHHCSDEAKWRIGGVGQSQGYIVLNGNRVQQNCGLFDFFLVTLAEPLRLQCGIVFRWLIKLC